MAVTDLKQEIADCFEAKQAPHPDRLVRRDGFDPFEKEDAVGFFSGKSWNDVLNHLCAIENSVIAGADYRLEEWSVLEPGPRHYYLRAYLEFLLATLSRDDPDAQFVSDLFHQLYQSICMHQDEAYSDTQKALLRNVAAYAVEAVEEHSGIEEWREGIIDNIDSVLAELEKNC